MSWRTGELKTSFTKPPTLQFTNCAILYFSVAVVSVTRSGAILRAAVRRGERLVGVYLDDATRWDELADTLRDAHALAAAPVGRKRR